MYPAASSCELSYTAPGNYTLSADVGSATAMPASCISIAASGVTLDCAQHAITGFVIVAQGTTDVAIRNCTATGVAPIVNASNLTVEGNRLATSLYFNDAHGVVVRGNHIFARPAAPAVVALSGGHGNRVIENSLDGGGTRGADDGIVLADESGDTISDNTISNVFDAGVEGIDGVTDTVIARNTMMNTSTAGVSSYWCTAWRHVTIENNRISGTRAGIRFEYSGGPGDGHCTGWGSPQALNFSDNVIAGNVLGPLVPSTTPAITVKLDEAASSVTGNVIRDNQFGASPIDVHPLAGFHDGGGNVCGPSGSFKC